MVVIVLLLLLMVLLCVVIFIILVGFVGLVSVLCWLGGFWVFCSYFLLCFFFCDIVGWCSCGCFFGCFWSVGVIRGGVLDWLSLVGYFW